MSRINWPYAQFDWRYYFDNIFLINLKRRTDRLADSEKLLNEYGIRFQIFEAYDAKANNHEGYSGLIVTMKRLFERCLMIGYKSVLVFEDDVMFLQPPKQFHDTLNKCVLDLEGLQWDLFYLGLQQSKKFERFVTPNILPVDYGNSTHAVAYSKKAMQFIMDNHFERPIDNFLVHEFQPFNTSYCSYPLLATQRAGMSDIGGQVIDWGIYIEPNFEKFVRHLLPR